jgi:hypothetical protein
MINKLARAQGQILLPPAQIITALRKVTRGKQYILALHKSRLGSSALLLFIFCNHLTIIWECMVPGNDSLNQLIIKSNLPLANLVGGHFLPDCTLGRGTLR